MTNTAKEREEIRNGLIEVPVFMENLTKKIATMSKGTSMTMEESKFLRHQGKLLVSINVAEAKISMIEEAIPTASAEEKEIMQGELDWLHNSLNECLDEIIENKHIYLAMQKK